MKTKTIAIIPARKGSKRLPDKNKLLLGNLPLIVHSILYAQQNSHIIDTIYISTNDEELIELLKGYQVEVIKRPDAIAGDLEPTITALQHVLEEIKAEVENVVLLQATNPLRPLNLLNDAYKIFTQGNHDSLFTVSRNTHKLGKIIDNNFIPLNYSVGQRSQDLEPLYYENGLLYIAKANLIKQGTLISTVAFPMIIEHPFASVDIDTQKDYDFAQIILKKYSQFI